jgi:hypothetical protein
MKRLADPEFEIEKDHVAVLVGRDDLSFLANCINESLGAVEDWEFQTRLGVTRSEARDAIKILSDLARSIP